MKKIVIIDGKSVFYRGFYALGNLSLKDGTPTGGVYGFASILLTAIEKLQPDNIYVAWDKSGTSISKRKAVFADYKAGRVKPPADFYAQIPILQSLLEAFNIPFYELDDYEADDIIGSLAVQAQQQGGIETYLISSDMDMLQVIGPKTQFYALKTGFSNIDKFTEANFEAKFGVKLDQFLDYKALRGDPSDNIPGVPGVGEKTATKLLNAYHDIDGIYNNLDKIKESLAKKLADNKDLVMMSKQLAKIYIDAPVKLDLQAGQFSDVKPKVAYDKLTELEFKSLARRLDKILAIKVKSDDKQSGLFDSKTDTKLNNNFIQVEDLAFLDKIDDDELIIDFDDDFCYLRIAKKDYKIAINNFTKQANVCQQYYVIVRKVKDFLYQFDKTKSQKIFDLPIKYNRIYDINQAEFLLDPLRRTSQLETIAKGDLTALEDIYQSQIEQLAKHKELDKIARQFDFQLAPVIYLIEKRGVKIDKQFFADFSESLAKQEQALSQEIYDLAGQEFNINSPQQLSKVMYEDLELPTKGIKKLKTGYSTGKKELDKLFDQHPIIAKIIELREITKLKHTYVDPLPAMTDAKSRLHSTFNQDVTSTGRLSSTNPNLQNIPIKTELGRRLRQGFIADKNNVLISADYAQFELRLAAFLSGDEEMLKVFNENRDIHTETAAQIYQKSAADVTKRERTVAKTVNFSVLYGAGPRNLTQTVKGMSFQEAKDLIEKYFAARQPLRNFMDQTLAQAKQDGFVQTYFGRRRPTPDINSPNFIIREAAKRASMNMPIQGTGADIMKLAMIKLELELDKKFPQAQQIVQIHDSIVVEAPATEAADVGELMREIMQKICPELNINLAVDVKIGPTWFDL